MTTRYLPLACFGKLPFWREYLESGAAHPTSRSLKQWLHQGREALGLENAEEGLEDRAFDARLRMLIGVPGSKELLAGVVRPSNDAGGRHFPFAVFTHFPRRVFGKHYAMLPLALAPVWDSLDDAWGALFAATHRQAFEHTLSSFEVPGPGELSEVRGDYQGRAREGAAALFEGEPGSSPGSLEANMPAVLARLRESGAGAPHVQLPVSQDLTEACFNASFWIDLLNRQFLLRRFEPSVLLDAGASAPRRMFLKFGALEPADYIDIVGRSAQTQLLQPARAPTAVPPPPQADLDRMTYGELLATRFGRGR